MSCRGRRTGDNHQVMRGRHGEEGRGERWRAAAMMCSRWGASAQPAPMYLPGPSMPSRARVLSQSPELSLMPTICSGKSAWSRPVNVQVMPDGTRLRLRRVRERDPPRFMAQCTGKLILVNLPPARRY